MSKRTKIDPTTAKGRRRMLRHRGTRKMIDAFGIDCHEPAAPSEIKVDGGPFREGTRVVALVANDLDPNKNGVYELRAKQWVRPPAREHDTPSLPIWKRNDPGA